MLTESRATSWSISAIGFSSSPDIAWSADLKSASSEISNWVIAVWYFRRSPAKLSRKAAISASASPSSMLAPSQSICSLIRRSWAMKAALCASRRAWL